MLERQTVLLLAATKLEISKQVKNLLAEQRSVSDALEKQAQLLTLSNNLEISTNDRQSKLSSKLVKLEISVLGFLLKMPFLSARKKGRFKRSLEKRTNTCHLTWQKNTRTSKFGKPNRKLFAGFSSSGVFQNNGLLEDPSRAIGNDLLQK